jgi:hypothetical protein
MEVKCYIANYSFTAYKFDTSQKYRSGGVLGRITVGDAFMFLDSVNMKHESGIVLNSVCILHPALGMCAAIILDMKSFLKRNL